MNTETKVGLFFIIGIVLICLLIMKTGQFEFLNKGNDYELIAILDTAQGLNKDTDVRMAGVKIGKVDGIVLEKGKAKVTMKINQYVQLPEGSRIKVVAKGMLGDKYVEVFPAEYTRDNLKAGGLLESDKAVTMDDIMDVVYAVANDVKQITTSLKNTVGTNKGETQIANILENIDRITADLRELTQNNKNNVTDSIDNIKAFTAELKKEIPVLSEKLDKLATSLNEVVAENKDDLRKTIVSAKEGAEKINRTLDYMEDITKKVSSGEGTIGKLINNEETHKNLNDTLISVKSAADNATDFLGAFKDTGVYLGFRNEYMFDISESKSYFTVDIVPSGKRTYTLQLIDSPYGKVTEEIEYHRILDSNGDLLNEYTEVTTHTKDKMRYSALIGQYFGDFLVSVGLVESKGGFGIDYQPNKMKNFYFSFQAYDFSRDNDLEAHLKFTTTYKFYKDFYMVAGIDDFLESDYSQYFLGIGIRFRDDYFKHLLPAVSMK